MKLWRSLNDKSQESWTIELSTLKDKRTFCRYYYLYKLTSHGVFISVKQLRSLVSEPCNKSQGNYKNEKSLTKEFYFMEKGEKTYLLLFVIAVIVLEKM